METVGSSSQQSEKRRFRLRFFFKSLFHSEGTKSNAKAQNVLKMGLNFIRVLNKYLSQVLCVLFTAVSVITHKTPRLFYRILFLA